MTKKYLYSPWRLDYIMGEKPEDCVMCRARELGSDEDNLILFRGKSCYIMLNRYPYNNGHLMIVPYAHESMVNDLLPETWQEACELIKVCERVFHEAYCCEGINIGINLGSAAGAGIAEHLHIHMVPRWSGDSNFMSVVSGERVIPEAFESSYKRLKQEILRQLSCDE
ncbi:MAG: HIT domain-containing protein [Candidatus Cloacimonadaceae bacterium]|jgi:ATP adenylyltransferase|nr:HIT domain-containing protein [Candidatus Cloacimonadota bacterium]MDY0127558.1 HIT domain-containing protein [Candidatus Cloacimonadaceae bacterium]MCB5254599.1 HIT domain-containing protein [Candidatus Cloacimonadota bacterium]MCK9178250.1 HIT domain-containing protein [Candidatus Cloacimonadota bacterium]MCK9242524.1 HIT domain-containing protein [Candidatus Cloacimonadota bacterium]